MKCETVETGEDCGLAGDLLIGANTDIRRGTPSKEDRYGLLYSY